MDGEEGQGAHRACSAAVLSRKTSPKADNWAHHACKAQAHHSFLAELNSSKRICQYKAPVRLTMLSARTIMLWAASVARRPCAGGEDV